MNIASKTVLLLMVAAMAVGCGYSKPKTTMPAIAQLNPGMTTAGSGAFQLEVDGANFASGAVVNFNGSAETTTFVNATKLEANIPAAAILASGTVTVTVTNPGTSGMYATGPVTSAPTNFTVN